MKAGAFPDQRRKFQIREKAAVFLSILETSGSGRIAGTKRGKENKRRAHSIMGGRRGMGNHAVAYATHPRPRHWLYKSMGQV